MNLCNIVNAYEEMTHLPTSLYENDKVAVIMPIFFITPILKYCNSVESCAYLSLFILRVIFRASAIHPKNKKELIMCLNAKICSIDKRLLRTHVD